MKRMKLVLLLVMGGLVSACSATNVATRNAPFEATQPAAVAQPAVDVAPSEGSTAVTIPVTDVRVEEINISVPRSLTVSEANRYLPGGDIVWRGDPIGDRHAQVQAIFKTAFDRGTQTLDGRIPVVLDVEVKRFHAMTEKARYTVGGVHSITFDLMVRDATTGALLREPRTVRADLDGFGGRQALLADARGHTQKVRITAHLAEVIRQELTQIEGYENARLGFFQAMNNL